MTDKTSHTRKSPKRNTTGALAASSRSAPRKRGGQRGNHNAFKHGFYAVSYTKLEDERLETGVKGELKDEENMLRIIINRTIESMRGRKMTYEDNVVALRALALAVGRIESIQRSRKVIYDKETTLEKALEELKYISLEED
jgi:hypothetical protein